MRCDAWETLPAPEIHLFHGKKKCRRFLERHGLEFECPELARAVTFAFVSDGTPYAAVLIGRESLGMEDFEDMALIAHEAGHVAMFAFECMGEENPAEEEFCYMLQSITGSLCEAHLSWKASERARTEGKANG